MTKTFRIISVLMLLVAFKMNATAQVLIDNTNLLTQLEGINDLKVDEAQQYFIGLGYALSSKKTVTQSTYSMDLYKFKNKDKSNAWLLSVIAGSITGTGYITYSEDEYKAAIKAVKDAGFGASESLTHSDQSVWAKGNLRFVVQQQTVDGKTFYVMMLSDVLKTAKLAGLKQ